MDKLIGTQLPANLEFTDHVLNEENLNLNTFNLPLLQQSISIEYRSSKEEETLKSLPIYPKMVDIVSFINNTKGFSTISAPTGSGKSLGIPAFLLKQNRNEQFRIFMAEPTRAAAYNLHAQESKILPKVNIGYAAERQVKYNDESKIIYVTNGHLKNLLYSFVHNGAVLPQFKQYKLADYIFLDESHVQSLDNTVIMSLLNLFAKNNIEIPKLILLSATPGESYIASDTLNIEMTSPYSVEIKYENKDYTTNNNKLYEDAATVALQYHYYLNQHKMNGDILVFAPGKAQITIVQDTLTKIKPFPTDLIIYTVSGEKSQEVINAIYQSTTQRKLIIATNLLESAITINDLAVVVDTLTEKLSKTSYNGSIRLATEFISKSSAQQRKGRTGRTTNGICHRMCTEQFFDKLLDFRIPEIKRAPLHNVIIDLYAHGLPSKILLGADITQVDESNNLLLALDLVRKSEIQDKIVYTATPAGYFSSLLPLRVRLSRLLWEWLKIFPNRAYEGTVIVNLIEYGTSFFVLPRKEKTTSNVEYSKILKDYIAHNFQDLKAEDDLLTMMKTFEWLATKLKQNKSNKGKIWAGFNISKLQTICTNGKISYRKCREFLINLDASLKVINSLFYDNKMNKVDLALTKDTLNVHSIISKDNYIYHDMKYVLGATNIASESTKTLQNSMNVKLLAFRDSIYSLKNSGRNSYSRSDGIVYNLDSRNSISDSINDLPNTIVALDFYTIQNGLSKISIISFSVTGDQFSTNTISAISSVQKAKLLATLQKNNINFQVAGNTIDTTFYDKLIYPALRYKFVLPTNEFLNTLQILCAQNLLVNNVMSYLANNSADLQSIKAAYSNYAMYTRFFNANSNNVLVPTESIAYQDWLTSIKKHSNLDITLFKQEWDLKLLESINKPANIIAVSAEQQLNNRITFIFTLSTNQTIKVVSSFNLYYRILPLVKNTSLALVFTAMLSMVYKILRLPHLLKLPNDILNTFISLGFTNFVTSWIDNEYVSYNLAVNGFYPSLEQLIYPATLITKNHLLVLPPSLVPFYTAQTQQYKDNNYLFIYRIIDQALYHSLKSEHSYYFQSNIYSTLNKNHVVESLQYPYYFMLTSTDKNTIAAIRSISNQEIIL